MTGDWLNTANIARSGHGVTAFSTTRQGGYDQGPMAMTEGESRNYATFNINSYCGDCRDHVSRNREALCRLLHITGDRLLMPHQTHDDRVAVIDDAFLSLPGTVRRRCAAVVRIFPIVCL